MDATDTDEVSDIVHICRVIRKCLLDIAVWADDDQRRNDALAELYKYLLVHSTGYVQQTQLQRLSKT